MNFKYKHLLRSKILSTFTENKKANILLSVTSLIGFYVLYLLIKKIGYGFSSEQILNFPVFFAFIFVCWSFCLRAIRYSLLSSQFGNLTFNASLSILIKAYTLNNIIPFRAGEFYRIFRSNLDLDCSYYESTAITFIERVIDLAAYVFLSLSIFLISEQFFDLSELLDPSEHFWTAVLLVCVLLLIAFATLMSQSVRNLIFLILSYFYLISKTIPKSTFLTLNICALEMVAYWLVARVFEIELSLFQTAFIVGISNISTLFLPSPGGVGAFEYSIVFVLGHFSNWPIQDALAFALVTHAILIIPISITGLVMFSLSVELGNTGRIKNK